MPEAAATGEPAIPPAPLEAAANAAVRSLIDEPRSTRARCNSALADVKPAISLRALANSSRAMSQHAANATAMRHAAAPPAAHGHTGFAVGGGAVSCERAGAGIELRTSLTMRVAKLSRLATMKRRTSTA